MEGKGTRKQRLVRRCFEAHRLEEELLALAYEQIWPQLRRVVPRRRGAAEGPSLTPTARTANVARRA